MAVGDALAHLVAVAAEHPARGGQVEVELGRVAQPLRVAAAVVAVAAGAVLGVERRRLAAADAGPAGEGGGGEQESAERGAETDGTSRQRVLPGAASPRSSRM